MNNTCHVKSFFHFDCSEEKAVKRAGSDDAQKRYNTYKNNINPVLDTMKKLGKYVNIGAERPVESV